MLGKILFVISTFWRFHLPDFFVYTRCVCFFLLHLFSKTQFNCPCIWGVGSKPEYNTTKLGVKHVEEPSFAAEFFGAIPTFSNTKAKCKDSHSSDLGSRGLVVSGHFGLSTKAPSGGITSFDHRCWVRPSASLLYEKQKDVTEWLGNTHIYIYIYTYINNIYIYIHISIIYIYFIKHIQIPT